jgi:PKD repeat protein
MKHRRILFYLLALFVCCACHQEETIPVDIDFALQIKGEDYTSPLVVSIINNTQNAEEYLWTFDGGEPANSTKKDPGNVIFTSAGEHKVSLEAWNGGDRNSKILTIHVDSAVTLDFKAEVEINNYAPAIFNFKNLSSGGISYKWIFEGGEPASYEGVNPPAVTYAEQGSYTIILLANNGSSDFVTSQSIDIREPLDASFTIVPSFEDLDDMEAPLRATFDTWLQGVERIEWECEGAMINNENSPDANLLFRDAGKYTVYLNVSNGKQSKRLSQEINVKPNTNIRTHENIRLGINTAKETIGSFYSTQLRRSFKRSEIEDANGPFIDIAFLGLNADFIYNLFVSPDKLADTPLLEINGAKATKFVNKLEAGTEVQLTPAQFKSMTTDIYLKNSPIISVNYGDEYFTKSVLPRVVLFETSDRRKEAILIKEMISEGPENSYILVDIKVQKND